MTRRLAALAATMLAITACNDTPTATRANPRLNATLNTAPTTTAGPSTSTVRWNRLAIALFRSRGNPNVGRTNVYLSIAQYRAVRAAQNARHGEVRPSLAGAAAGASVVVLKQFYPLDVAAIDDALAMQRAESPFGAEINEDFAAGEAIGRAVAAAVLAWAVSDNFGVASPGVPPIGPGYWVSSGAPIVTSGLGARPFFLTSGSELRRGPPPVFGSDDYLAALAEVKAIDINRTAEQLAIARKWAPFAGPVWNGIATDLIDKYRKSELEAARIMAYASAAEFDAIIGCFDTKFTYWFIRPAQADPSIPLPIGMPNHPSYPSAHSCGTGAWYGILADAFPSERAMLSDLALEAGMARIYVGLHYRFDIEAGQALGRAAARLALERRGLE